MKNDEWASGKLAAESAYSSFNRASSRSRKTSPRAFRMSINPIVAWDKAERGARIRSMVTDSSVGSMIVKPMTSRVASLAGTT